MNGSFSLLPSESSGFLEVVADNTEIQFASRRILTANLTATGLSKDG